MKTVKFYTLGCKANQYDTQEMRERLLDAGLKEVRHRQKPDYYLINTCTVTHRADKDSLYLIHRSHRENPRGKIIVTGCMAETDRAQIASEPGVSAVVPNRLKTSIVSRIGLCPGGKSKGISFFAGHTRAFLKIQDGCDNFCSYCKVPLVRGRSRSKPLKDILCEARRLAGNGFHELVLTGICLGAYGKDLKPRRSLIDVLEALERIAGIERIRLSSIEAGDVSEALVRHIAASSKLCKHLHIPIQSGDSEILRRMNRSYCRQDYLRLCRSIRRIDPDMAITTDVLVGFPGETESHFRNTLSLVKAITPLKTHIFPYSRRERTAAAAYQETAPSGQTVQDRLRRLEKTAGQCSREFQQRFLGRAQEVLLEARCKDDPGSWEGFASNYIKVRYHSPRELTNTILRLKTYKLVTDHMLARLP